MNSHIKLYICICFIILLGCRNKICYTDYIKIEGQCWHSDSTLHYFVDIDDTLVNYNILLYLRHNNNYPYQNIWLFITDEENKIDTIECFLADQYGRWIGNNYGRLKEMPVMYKSMVSFKKLGMYEYTIKHGMRNECLEGVEDVGLSFISVP